MPNSILLHPQETDYSCAVACLRMVIEYLGVSKTEEELCKLSDCKFLGTDALKIVDAARSLNFDANKYNLSFEELLGEVKRGIHPIVYLRTNINGNFEMHSVVVVNIIENNGEVELLDPYPP